MASHKLVKFASFIDRGKSATEAARLAGYSESTATTKQRYLIERARAAGFLPSGNEVREIKDQVLHEMRRDVLDVAKALIAKAKDGDVRAAKEIIGRILGPIPGKHVPATEADMTTVATELIEIAAREAMTDAERAFADRLAARWLSHLQENV